MKTLRVFITGTVQSIFFKKFIEEEAKKIGVRGFVRNLEDGRLEVVIEGRDDKVNQMLEVCKRGYPHSQIRGIEVNEIKYQGFKDFRILKI